MWLLQALFKAADESIKDHVEALSKSKEIWSLYETCRLPSRHGEVAVTVDGIEFTLTQPMLDSVPSPKGLTKGAQEYIGRTFGSTDKLTSEVLTALPRNEMRSLSNEVAAALKEQLTTGALAPPKVGINWEKARARAEEMVANTPAQAGSAGGADGDGAPADAAQNGPSADTPWPRFPHALPTALLKFSKEGLTDGAITKVVDLVKRLDKQFSMELGEYLHARNDAQLTEMLQKGAKEGKARVTLSSGLEARLPTSLLEWLRADLAATRNDPSKRVSVEQMSTRLIADVEELRNDGRVREVLAALPVATVRALEDSVDEIGSAAKTKTASPPRQGGGGNRRPSIAPLPSIDLFALAPSSRPIPKWLGSVPIELLKFHPPGLTPQSLADVSAEMKRLDEIVTKQLHALGSNELRALLALAAHYDDALESLAPINIGHITLSTNEVTALRSLARRDGNTAKPLLRASLETLASVARTHPKEAELVDAIKRLARAAKLNDTKAWGDAGIDELGVHATVGAWAEISQLRSSGGASNPLHLAQPLMDTLTLGELRGLLPWAKKLGKGEIAGWAELAITQERAWADTSAFGASLGTRPLINFITSLPLELLHGLGDLARKADTAQEAVPRVRVPTSHLEGAPAGLTPSASEAFAHGYGTSETTVEEYLRSRTPDELDALRATQHDGHVWLGKGMLPYQVRVPIGLFEKEVKKYPLRLQPMRWTAGVRSRVRVHPIARHPVCGSVTAIGNKSGTDGAVLTVTIDNDDTRTIELEGAAGAEYGLGVYDSPDQVVTRLFRSGFRDINMDKDGARVEITACIGGPRYATGQRLLVVPPRNLAGRFCEATVVGAVSAAVKSGDQDGGEGGDVGGGEGEGDGEANGEDDGQAVASDVSDAGDTPSTTLYSVRLAKQDGDDEGGDEEGVLITLKLNEFNACPQRFESLSEYMYAHTSYLQSLKVSHATVLDELTGCELPTASQHLALTPSKLSNAHRLGLSDAKEVAALVALLSTPQRQRTSGGVPVAPILILGKERMSWVLPQLVHALALQLLGEAPSKPPSEANGEGSGSRKDKKEPDATQPPLVPLIIRVQELAQVLHTRPVDEPLDASVLLEHCVLAFADTPDHLMLLSTALELRSVVVFLEGVDEAAGRHEDIARLLTTLIRSGVQVVATCRPDGVFLDHSISYSQHEFVILELQTRTDAQSREAFLEQLRTSPSGNRLCDHMAALLLLRNQHDELYMSLFTDGHERERIECFQVPDRMYLLGGDAPRGAFDGLRRQRCLNGVRFIRPLKKAWPQSELLQQLCAFMRPNLLTSLDVALSELTSASHDTEPTPAEIASTFQRVLTEKLASHRAALERRSKRRTAASSPSLETLSSPSLETLSSPSGRAMISEEHLTVCAHLSTQLAFIGLKRTRQLHGDAEASSLTSSERRYLRNNAPQTSIAALWPRVVARTDELLHVAETMRPLYEHALENLLGRLNLMHADDGVEFTVGDLLVDEPIRIHERAFDVYLSRFDDGIIPEACVSDVLRARIDVSKGAHLTTLLEALSGGVDVALDGGLNVRLEIIRCENGFSRPTPAHMRSVGLTLSLMCDGLETLCELQLHHTAIAKLHHAGAARAHSSLGFFEKLITHRLLGGGFYGSGGEYARSPRRGLISSDLLEAALEKELLFLDEVASSPTQLAMLTLAFAAPGGDFEAVYVPMEPSSTDALATSMPPLPIDTYELYAGAMQRVLDRNLARAPRALRNGVPGLVQEIIRLLRMLAADNMRARRIQFTDTNVEEALPPHELQLWKRLIDEMGSVPLVRRLVASSASADGVFEFRHLSLQEALAVEYVLDADGAAEAFVASNSEHREYAANGRPLSPPIPAQC